MPNANAQPVIRVFTCLFATLVFSVAESPTFAYHSPRPAIALYQSIDFGTEERPAFDVFERAIAGYRTLLNSNSLSDKGILTIVDFRISANTKRLWVIDLRNNKLLFHTLVAHGRNSGNVFPDRFSNIRNSYQSSLGFYVTGDSYLGKHGLSLKLNGVEPGINDQAEARSIVMHGAAYVSETFIKKAGRLGRSLGCPAVPLAVYKKMISLLERTTCLFMYYPDPEYLSKTTLYSPAGLQADIASTN